MNNLQLDITKYKVEKSSITNNRAYMISQFLEKINQERVGTSYKPTTGRVLAIKLGHVKTWELSGFYKNCEQAKCGFSRAFFGSLKVDK